MRPPGPKRRSLFSKAQETWWASDTPHSSSRQMELKIGSCTTLTRTRCRHREKSATFAFSRLLSLRMGRQTSAHPSQPTSQSAHRPSGRIRSAFLSPAITTRMAWRARLITPRGEQRSTWPFSREAEPTETTTALSTPPITSFGAAIKTQEPHKRQRQPHSRHKRRTNRLRRYQSIQPERRIHSMSSFRRSR